MRLTSARRILEEVWGLHAGDADLDTLDTQWFGVIRSSLHRRLREAWEWHFWPELLRVEKRRYRDAWVTTDLYAAGDEIFYIPAGAYYQAVQASSGEAPASGATYQTENSAYWAKSAASYSGSDWVATTAYAVGDRVKNLVDGLYYQAHTAHTSGATWSATNWGVLTPLDKYILFEQTSQTAIGTCINVTEKDPMVHRNPIDVSFFESNVGIQVPNGPVEVYVELRIRSPELLGSAYSATATYATGRQVYFRNSSDTVNYPGDFFNRANSTSTAGQSPSSDSSNWTKVEFPWRFHKFLVTAVYEDLLVADGQQEKSGQAETRAATMLAEEVGILTQQTGNTRRTTVQTR